MMDNQDLHHFSLLISDLSGNKELIPIVDLIFPYKYFRNTGFENICYWLPLFTKLHQSGTTFCIKVLGREFDFVYENKKQFTPIYLFNEENNLILSPGTSIEFAEIVGKSKKRSIPKDCDNKKLIGWSNLFYNITLYLMDCKTKIKEEDLRKQSHSLPPNPKI